MSELAAAVPEGAEGGCRRVSLESVAGSAMLANAALAAGAAVFVWRRKGATGRTSLSVGLAGAAIWSFAYGFELFARSLPSRVFWGSAKYLGSTLLPPAWLIFSLQYTGRRRRQRVSWRLVALAIEPAVVLGLLAVSSTRHLIRSYPPGRVPDIPVVRLGPGYWAHFAYTNAVYLLGSGLLVVTLVRVSRLYWRQARVLAAALVVPWVINILASVDPRLLDRIDPTPVTITLAGLVFVWGVFRFHLLDLVPLARAALIEMLGDGVVVVDAAGRVVDLNPAAESILGRPGAQAAGQPVQTLLNALGDLPSHDRATNLDVSVGEGQGARNYQLSFSDLHDERGGRAGQLLLMRDISERKQAEDERNSLFAQINRERQRLETLLAQLPVAVLIAEAPFGQVVLANEQVQRILEPPSSSQQADGERKPARGPPSTGRWYEVVEQLALARSLLGGEVVSGEERQYQRSDGQTRILHLSSAPICDDDGATVGAIAVFSDITERKLEEGVLAHRALHDPLTGLPNRVLFVDRVGQAMVQSVRPPGRQFAVMFFDLDNFKYINDALGHLAGNVLLAAVAARLRQALRPGDTVARLGGDEFAMLCSDIADEQVSVVASRLTDVLAAPFLLDDQEVFVTASVGIAMGHSHRDPEAVLQDADAAMHQAKARGRARHQLFDSSMRTQARRRLSLEGRLRRAVDRGEFELYYQPEVALATETMGDVEALLRWNDPQHGLLLPAEFIGLAETSGLITAIGGWAIQDACRQLRAWGQLRVSVNLSARQFGPRHLARVVAAALDDTGADPTALCLEITESVLMDDAVSTIEILRELKDLGVRLAIDDFGTGYSSLSYLKRFPIDLLKVDRSFIAGLGSDPEDSAIVPAVIALAHALDLRVVAEGVETEQQRTILLELGCDLGQGFYWGAAVQPAQLSDLFDTRPGSKRPLA